MEPSHGERSGRRKSDLSLLLKALSESLSDDSSNDQEFVIRLRNVIPQLLNAFIDPKSVKDRELRSVLALFDIALEKHPATFFNGRGVFAVQAFCRLLPLVTELRFRGPVHEALLSTLSSILSLVATGNNVCYYAFIEGAADLLEDLHEVADLMSGPAAHFAAATKVTVQGFILAFETALASEPQPAPSSARSGSDSQQLECTLSISSEQWEPLARTMLHIVGHGLQSSLPAVVATLAPHTVSCIAGLLPLGSPDFQKVGCDVLARLAIEMDSTLFPAEDVLEALIQIFAQLKAPASRTEELETALGECLSTVSSTCPPAAFQCVIQAFLHQLPKTVSCTSTCYKLKVPPAAALLAASRTPRGTPGLSLLGCYQAAPSGWLPERQLGPGRSWRHLAQAPRSPSGGFALAPRGATRMWRDLQRASSAGRVVLSASSAGRGVLPLTGSEEATMARWLQIDLCKSLEHMLHALPSSAAFSALAATLPLLGLPYMTLHLTACMQLIVEAIPELAFPRESSSTRSAGDGGAAPMLLEDVPVSQGASKRRRLQAQGEAAEGPGEHDCPGLAAIPSAAENMILAELAKLQPPLPDELAALKVLLWNVVRVRPWGDALQVLGLAVSDSDSRVRAAAARVAPFLHNSPPADREVIGMLSMLACDNAAEVREAVAHALGSVTCLHAANSGSAPASDLSSASHSIHDSVVGAWPNGRGCQIHLPTLVRCGECRQRRLSARPVPAADNPGISSPSPVRPAPAADNPGISSPSPAKPLLQRQLTFAGAEQATSLAGGGWAAAAGGGLCCLSPETWGALVTKLATEELAPETVVACLGGVQRVVAHAVPNQLHGSRDALQECLRMIAHPHRPVREALADMLPTLMHPSVLQEIYGSDLITPAEHCLLHAIRDVLETAPDQEVRSTALAMFSQVARSASGLVPDTPDIVLIVLVGRLDDPDWGLRAAAVEAIQEEATRRHVPTKEMILYQSKRVLSYIGQNLCEKPDVAVMVAEALLDGMNLQSFLGTVLEVVVASLVAKGDRPNLEEFARLIERPLPALMLDYTPWFIADLVLDEDMDREEKDRHIIFFQEMLEEESLEDAVGRHAVTVVQKLVEQAGSRDEEYAAAGEMDAGTCIDNTAELLKDKVAALAQMQQMDQVDVPEYLSRDFLQHLADVSNQLKRDTAAAPSRRDQLCLGGMQEARRRRRALHSLAVLVELIGNRLPQYVPQVMALLTNGLEYPDALPVALAIWRRFVRALGAHAPQRLRQVAHQIVVVLLPHLEEAAPQVRAAAGVLHELLVVPAHRKALGTALHRLPMLPAHAALQAANAVLEQERGAAPLQQRLQRLADSLQAESHGVGSPQGPPPPLPVHPTRPRAWHTTLSALRIASLSVPCAPIQRALATMSLKRTFIHELQRMTGTQRESLGTLLLQSQAHTQLSGGGQSPEGELSVASVLYTALLKCCCVGLHTAVANNVRYMAAQVLGELGAADPARVQVVLPPPPKIICNDHAFARALLEEHLVRVLRTAYDLDMLETAAFSIQELLKSLDCRLLDHPAAPPPAMPAKSQRKSGGAKGAAGAPSLSGKSAGGAAGVQVGGEGAEFWARLPEDLQEVVAPCLSSKYVMQTFHPQRVAAVPIFANARHLSFRRWLVQWSRHMLAGAAGPRLKMLEASQGVWRFDSGAVQYLLPYLVHAVVCYGTPAARDDVLAELLAVLEEAGHGSGSRVAPARGGEASGGLTGGSGTATATRTELSAQAVFTLLDQLQQWVEQQRELEPSSGASAKSGQSLPSMQSSQPWLEEEVCKMERFLEAIPKEALTHASRSCRANARALMYFETHVRCMPGGGALNQASKRTVTLSEADVSLLRDVYSGLEEPDGLEGLACLRQAPLLEDEMWLGEQAGRWWEALTLHELAQRSDTDPGASTSARRGGSPAPAASAQAEPKVLALPAPGEGRAQRPGRAPGEAQGGSAGGSGPKAAEHGRLRCLLGAGHLESVLGQVDGLLSRPGNQEELRAYGVAAAWRLGRWDRVSEFLGPAGAGAGTAAGDTQSRRGAGAGNARGGVQEAFEVSLGKVLLALEQRDEPKLYSTVKDARAALLAPLAAASMESYDRAYPYLVQLHLLQEAEASWPALAGSASHASTTPGRGASPAANCQVVGPKESARILVSAGWAQRLRLMQPSLNTWEPQLAMRRRIYALCGLRHPPPHMGIPFPVFSFPCAATREVAQTWLQYAKLSRRVGHLEAASLAVLEAARQGAEGARLERAKLLWQRGDLTSAMSDLQLAVQAHSTGGGTGNQRLRAKELIQLANMVHRTGQKEKTAVIQYYHKAIAASKSWEKGYFYFASYLDALLQDAMGRTHQPKPAPAPPVRGKEQASQGSGDGVQEYLLQTVRHYGMSLKYGHKHIYQSLPRMLTLWLDFGERSAGSTGSAAGLSMRASMPRSTPQSAQKKVMADLNQLMERMVKELPAYQWYTALPQLTSRICHPVPEVQTLVKRILGRIVGEFPQQALWFLALVARSTHHARKQHGSEVLNAAKQQTSSEDKRIRDLHTQFGQIIDQLIKLCFEKPKTPDGVRKAANKPFLVSRDFGVLKRMMPLHVMVPIQTALTATLPTDGCTHMEHAPFGQLAQVTVHSLVEEVEVMASLQKPKKLTIIGSDGKHYSFLCKPKDDLRKDMRMMELNGMLNRLLAKERESRRRKLYLRTFAVVPLTEECGLVEWVPNTRGLRHILQELYEAAGIFVRRANQSLAQLKMIYEKHQNPEQRMQLSCKMFPPIFHRWFLACFPEPAAWFRARAAFAHTAAVWSMVGHTVGLGDRHGENLLLDCTTADCVHVDFSCLFDKGLELECPECVPFRLTQNLVDGCGITGYEGMFSKVCEITLKVLRENRESMMSVLETFVHDPLLEWTTAAMRRQTTEEPNNRPRKALDKIKSRLEGVVVGVGAAPSLPLGPHGQARRLMEEATSHENLGSMYIWWMPWF
ncbi:hypothetical protein CYMTET_15995 [Cymbomonas tetramitiformis]|uniref:non-specific serine/threonine protein kinase n=1 Tax=Cymbomonas tetramitiformis TaxID=36881 RepID=A0AAE0GD30_9CHLO|nr:hypothetical protein CYMTET_15995 [Cymbomonas tetramitiformis]